MIPNWPICSLGMSVTPTNSAVDPLPETKLDPITRTRVLSELNFGLFALMIMIKYQKSKAYLIAQKPNPVYS